MASYGEAWKLLLGFGKREVIIYISKWVSVARWGGSSKGSEIDDVGERAF